MVCPRRRVQDYVKNRLESELIDPDGGANIERKGHELATASGSVVDLDLTVSFSKDGWTKSLKKLKDALVSDGRRTLHLSFTPSYVVRSVGMLLLAMVETMNLWQLPTVHVNTKKVHLTLL